MKRHNSSETGLEVWLEEGIYTGGREGGKGRGMESRYTGGVSGGYPQGKGTILYYEEVITPSLTPLSPLLIPRLLLSP